MSQLARNMLAEQRKRLVGTLMNFVESEIFPKLNDREQKALRTKVIGAVNQYHDVCLDLIKAAVPDGTVGNDEALRALERSVVGLTRELRTGVQES